MASSEASFDEDVDELRGFVIGYTPKETRGGEESITRPDPTGDRRTVVHQMPGRDRADLLKPPWKNIFLLYAPSTRMRGTAFLTDMTREHDGVVYAVLLTCAHNLCRKVSQKPPTRQLVTSIKLYQAYELSGIRPNVEITSPSSDINVHCFLDMRLKQNLARRKGWFAVSPSYLQSPRPYLDVGIIFVRMDYMDAVPDFEGMKNCFTVAPRSAPVPQLTQGVVAGFPLTYGGTDGSDKDTHYLLTCPGQVLSPSPKIDGVEVHDADTSKGNSGSPYFIEGRDATGALTYYAVGIHYHGFPKSTFYKLYDPSTPQAVQAWNPKALNAYRIIDDTIVQLAKTLPAMP